LEMAFFSIIIATFIGFSDASSFLSRIQEAPMKDITADLEASILQEVEDMLGSNPRNTEPRLRRVEDALRTTYMAMPKNEQGKLGHAAVRYVLHSYFLQRHAWVVRGLAGGYEQNAISPTATAVLQDKVEEFVQGAFEQRLGSHGLDSREISALAATYENLIHKETMQRLDATFKATAIVSAELEVNQVDHVLDMYMISYILNLNYSRIQPGDLVKLQNSITSVYPTWSKTQKFLREVRSRSSLHRSFYTRSDVEGLVEDIFDQYGQWQDAECRDLKERLMKLEDKSVGVNGSGRVRLGDFYGSALTGGNWQFSESQEYLNKLGALDVHSGTPRVIIPNYINSPSNCLASSKFYAVCCINQCEDLMDKVEHRFAKPSASPEEIAEFVATMPSSSVQGGRALHPALVARLDEIAEHHQGQVPLHGRLFAQWMHHAYPRECPYPHITGTVRPQSPEEYVKQHKLLPVASKGDMQRWVAEYQTDSSDEVAVESDEVTPWHHQEELYVGQSVVIVRSSPAPGRVRRYLGPLVYMSALATFIFTLVRRSSSLQKAAACTSSGKDLFV